MKRAEAALFGFVLVLALVVKIRVAQRLRLLPVITGDGFPVCSNVGLLLWIVALLVQQIIDLLFQSGQIVFDGGGDSAEIYVKVIVDYLIAHTPHVDPW